VGRSATVSGDAIVMKGTMATERRLAFYVPRHFQSRSYLR
jgi:hypothetical protein